MDYQDKSIFK